MTAVLAVAVVLGVVVVVVALLILHLSASLFKSIPL